MKSSRVSQGQGVIKPIACRPVVSSANTTPILGNRCLNSQQQQQQQQPTSSPASNSNNNNNNNAGRHSWGLYNSTSDLRSASLSTPQQTPTGGSRGPHLQRFSWSKSHAEPAEMSTLCARPVAQQQQQPQQPPPPLRKLEPQANPAPIQQQNKAAAGSITSINSVASNSSQVVNSQQGRVADLSRRFGGSLSSVAAPPNSPTQIRQPPAYRPPPSSSRSSGELFSSFLLGLRAPYFLLMVPLDD